MMCDCVYSKHIFNRATYNDNILYISRLSICLFSDIIVDGDRYVIIKKRNEINNLVGFTSFKK